MIKRWIKSALLHFGLELKYIRSTSIPFGVKWYQDIQYFPNGCNLDIIFDVGANIGQTASTAIKHFPNSRIYSFEPVPSTFQALLAKTKLFPQVIQINSALGSQISRLPITSKPLAQTNTLISSSDDLKENNCETVFVDVDTIDNFCKENKIDKINLLKIDTEGYEIEVLKGAKQFLSLNKIDYILAECEFVTRTNEIHGNFVEILNYLQPFQYNVVSFYTGGVNNLGWIWGDVLFRKTDNSPPNHYAYSPFCSYPCVVTSN